MDRPPTAISPLRRLLAPLSVLYGTGIRLRNARYDRDPQASHLAGLPVISVGNVTVGGTGKTPIVMEVVRRLLALGRRPAILTRGYGAATGEASDEVMEYAELLPDVPVVVDPDRVAGARAARAELGADCVVLDDGFQHRRLRRDLDIVVIDALDPWGGGWILPVGRLRESLQSLARADVLIISRTNQVVAAQVEEIETALNELAPHAALLSASVEPQSLAYPDGRRENAEALSFHCVLPVCGIGNPATFLHCVQELAGRVCPALVFRDHHRYRERDVPRIAALARRRGADLVVTTRKDWVKLAPLWLEHAVKVGADLARLDVCMQVQDEDGVLDECLAAALAGRAKDA